MASKKDTNIYIHEVNRGKVEYHIVGETPLICNRVSEKAKRQLLAPTPGGRKSKAAQAKAPKHDPLGEFRASPYVNRDSDGETLLQVLSAWFKRSMTDASLDMPDITKSKIGRLVWVEGERLDLYGIPELKMDIVRSADMNKTPDVRSRAVLREWACVVTVSFIQPQLKEKSVTNLLASAGIMQGVGDFRVGKGAGSFGQFRLAREGDELFDFLRKTAGRDPQIEALRTPSFYDQESEELFEWHEGELNERGFELNGRSEVDSLLEVV